MGTNADKRARQKANRDAARKALGGRPAGTGRRRNLVLLGVVAAVAVLIVAVVVLAGGDGEDGKDEGADETTSSTTPEPTTSAVPAEGEAAALPAPAEGMALTTDTPCPPAEGSEKRVQVFAGPPPTCIDPSTTDYSATVTTTEGTFTAVLDAQATPVTVNNFVVLSRYHYFDGVPFHRIVPGFVIQAGDGDGEPWGNNDLGYQIPDELPGSPDVYTDYSLAMANAGPDTGASQFFVILPGGGARLGPQYSRFGEVTEGREVVDAIGGLGNAGEQPVKAVVIDSVTITETPR